MKLRSIQFQCLWRALFDLANVGVTVRRDQHAIVTGDICLLRSSFVKDFVKRGHISTTLGEDEREISYIPPDMKMLRKMSMIAIQSGGRIPISFFGSLLSVNENQVYDIPYVMAPDRMDWDNHGYSENVMVDYEHHILRCFYSFLVYLENLPSFREEVMGEEYGFSKAEKRSDLSFSQTLRTVDGQPWEIILN